MAIIIPCTVLVDNSTVQKPKKCRNLNSQHCCKIWFPLCVLPFPADEQNGIYKRYMYESQYKCISARHARRAVPATRRPRVTECHRTVTKPSQNVTDCSKMSQRRRAARAGRRMLATPRPPRGARRPPPSRHRMSQKHHRMSHIATNCHRAAVPRAPGGACSPGHACRAAPATRRPRVTECHKNDT